jgi:hypothetical protein
MENVLSSAAIAAVVSALVNWVIKSREFSALPSAQSPARVGASVSCEHSPSRSEQNGRTPKRHVRRWPRPPPPRPASGT